MCLRAPAAPFVLVLVLVAPEFALPPAFAARWLAKLPAARRSEIGRWPARRDRERALLAMRLLFEALRRLGHRAAVATAALGTLRRPAGARPRLDLPVHFSVSHCDGRIVCAVSTGAPVGVDVEALGSLTAQAFRRYLTPAERAWGGLGARRFYAIWTRKEAVAKAAGTRGLPALPHVDTMTGPDRAAFGGRCWRTVALPVGRRHIAHLALADGRARVRVEHMDRPRLLYGAGPRQKRDSPRKARGRRQDAHTKQAPKRRNACMRSSAASPAGRPSALATRPHDPLHSE